MAENEELFYFLEGWSIDVDRSIGRVTSITATQSRSTKGGGQFTVSIGASTLAQLVRKIHDYESTK